MKDVIRLIVAIVVIILAWKIIKGIVGILIGLALAGVIVFVGMKLLEDKSE